MTHVIGEHDPEVEIKGIDHEHGDSPTEQSQQMREARKRSMPAPPYSVLMVPGWRAALMAVVDESGYLISVFTVRDLLHRCKSFWRASQD